MIQASTKRKTPINRGFSNDSYILLDSELNIALLRFLEF